MHRASQSFDDFHLSDLSEAAVARAVDSLRPPQEVADPKLALQRPDRGMVASLLRSHRRVLACIAPDLKIAGLIYILIQRIRSSQLRCDVHMSFGASWKCVHTKTHSAQCEM